MMSSNQTSGSYSFVTPVKLDQNNFIVWRTQILTTIKGNGLESFINGDRACPEQFLPSAVTAFDSTRSEDREINPGFFAWVKTDQLILSWMMSSIQQNLPATVIHCSTAKELLDTLTSMFISQSHARIMPLKMQIQTLKKGSMSMIDYFAKMKRLSDSLALAGKPIELSDFVQYVLTGLDSSDYESLVTSVLARGDKINLDEFYSLLLSHENRIEQKRGKIASDVTHNLLANMAKKQFNSGKNVGGNPRYNNNGTYGGGVYGNFANRNGMGQSGDGNSTIVCQICFVPGHGAHKCKNRYNSAFVPSRNQARGNFNGNFRAGQRNFERGFGNSGGRFFNGAYGRGFNSQFGNVFTNHNAGNFNLPRGPGYQSYVMCSDPAAFYVTQLSSSIGASSSASGFGFTGDYSGCSPSAPTVPTPEMVEDPTWYIDSGATNHITNDAGQELRDHLA